MCYKMVKTKHFPWYNHLLLQAKQNIFSYFAIVVPIHRSRPESGIGDEQSPESGIGDEQNPSNMQTKDKPMTYKV